MMSKNHVIKEPTMHGYVMRIVLEILRQANEPLSNNQIEQRARNFTVTLHRAEGNVEAGGHTITDSRTTIRSLIGMGYDIRSEWRQKKIDGHRYKVYWLVEEVRPRVKMQLSIFDIDGV